MMRIRGMMVGSLRYYAHEHECNKENEEAELLENLADKIENDSATTEEWIEAIERIDVSDLIDME